ncbi:short-chain dehydrogenase [Reticulibacter mediterranei]|uniref:Short-chain dehydrogenase n=1 Tax=Reticulibacter mediterranei TaxID=2778369 RepID=A0A8J3IQN5_9CHLR|nr:SDR family NAD(P)-dependent oxidoreductase [Reticulibacter mediterranei]GHO98981.1 short-chain dehydrogenase [Reticulibacter mediterranei]
MKHIDKNIFGPWAVITGASSGIGKEFARQVAASGINLILVARRLSLLEATGEALARDYNIGYRALALDLSQEGFLERLEAATRDLDIGLVVSNAGTANPGPFLSNDPDMMHQTVRLSVLAHLDLTHHFGAKLAARRRGGIILLSGMGASQGVPYMAHDSATRAYVLTLGETLHTELKQHHVQVTVLLPSPTHTPLFEKIGFDAASAPLRPMTAEQCVSEGLTALCAHRPSHVTGALYRVMDRLTPRSLFREMNGRMLHRTIIEKQRGYVGDTQHDVPKS